VAVDQIWRGELYNDSEFLVNSGFILDLSGPATDATRYLELTAAPGQSFIDSAGISSGPLRYDVSKGVGLRVTGNYSNILRVTGTTKFVASRLQMYYDSAFSSNDYIPCELQGAGSRYADCLYESRRTSASDFFLGANDLINLLLVQRGASFSGNVLTQRSTTPNARIINCTIVRPSDLGEGGSGVDQNFTSYGRVQNCAIFGFATPVGSTLASYEAGSGFNATNKAATALPGSGNVHSLVFADQFENVTDAARDWRPKSAGGLVGFAARADSYTSDLDIIGAARSTTAPTIGAREYVGAGPLAFGSIGNTATENSANGHRFTGGTFPEAGELADLRVYMSGWAGGAKFRFAVYQGGSAGNPTGAALVWESSEITDTNGTAGWRSMVSSYGLTPAGELGAGLVWVFVKNSDGATFLTESDRGAWATGSEVSSITNATATAFPSTVPTDPGTSGAEAIKAQIIYTPGVPPAGASEGPGLVIGDEAGFVGEGAVGAPNTSAPTWNDAIAETIAAADTATASQVLAAAIGESIATGESVASLLVSGRVLAETVAAAEVLAATGLWLRVLAETVAAAESTTSSLGGATYSRDVAETVAAADSASAIRTGTGALSEAAAVADLVAGALAAAAAVSEAAACAETLSAIMTRLAALPESAAVSDALSAAQLMLSALSDSVVTDATVTDGGASFTSTVSESVGAGDAIAATQAAGRALAEAAALADSASATRASSHAIADSAAVAELLAASRAFGGVIADSVAALDALGALGLFSASLVNAAAVTDTVNAAALVSAALGENVTPEDILSIVADAGSGDPRRTVTVRRDGRAVLVVAGDRIFVVQRNARTTFH
jgi:hypothetical protein